MNDIITIKGILLAVSDKEKHDILDMMILFGNSKRYAFNRIVKDNIDILDIEKDCYKKFIHNGRFSKDSVYLAKTIISAHREYLKWLKGIYHNRIKYLNNKIDKLLKRKKSKFIIKQRLHLYSNKIIKLQNKLSKIQEQIDSGDNKGIIFGGKKNWKLFNEGKISKSEWKQLRNNELYSRGEKSHKGNSNLRLVEIDGKLYLRINDIIKNEKYHIRLFVPQKKIQYLDFTKHTVLLKYKNNKFDVHVTSHITQKPIYLLEKGAIGIDINPKHINASIVSKEGNYLGSRNFNISDVLNISTNKTMYILGNKIKKIVKLAKWQQKGIVIENLKFKDKIRYSKLNRLLKNFTYSKIIELFQLRCLKEKVELKMINPAFTSFIGFAKYSLLYNMSIHDSAAFVIGRRGLKFKERLPSIYECLVEQLERRNRSGWKMWSDLRKKFTTLKVKSINDLQKLNMALNIGGIPVLERIIPDNSRISKIDRGIV